MNQEVRIELLPRQKAVEAAATVGIPQNLAELSAFRILLHHPELSKAVMGQLGYLLFRGKLDPRLRELVIMRIGWVTKSAYEWAQHWRVATQLGISEADLLAVRDWRGAERFGDTERAVLAATDEVLERGKISDPTWRSCKTALRDADLLIELVVAIGNWLMFATLLQSLEIPLEDGVTAWPPDGQHP